LLSIKVGGGNAARCEKGIMFTETEVDLLDKFRRGDNGFPFECSNKELGTLFIAIERERGNAEAEARRKVRVWVANKFHWTYPSTTDGGFMTGSSKEWPRSDHPFGKVFQLLENLVLHLLANGWDYPAIDAAIDGIVASSSKGIE
jgi:hypothetical protein